MSGETGVGRRLLRRAVLGRGPLKRGSDRLELASRVLLAAVLLLAVPVALAVGTVAHAAAQRVAAVQAADRSQQVAVLVDDAPPATLGTTGDRHPTQARWTAPDGTARSGTVPARPGMRAGDEVTVWLDADGGRVPAPMSADDVFWQAFSQGVLVFLGTAGTAGLLHLGVCRALWRQRSRRWEREWADVEPEWAGRRRPA
ncbi:hypothetical protein [Modestobacter sp. NPDC049651]|uniref:Rv1733c family protein n=1 Tax=unclassified Modestobacter TaxID=2643866 RepID=UPI0033E104BE